MIVFTNNSGKIIHVILDNDLPTNLVKRLLLINETHETLSTQNTTTIYVKEQRTINAHTSHTPQKAGK